jgi:hypothetical protein
MTNTSPQLIILVEADFAAIAVLFDQDSDAAINCHTRLKLGEFAIDLLEEPFEMNDEDIWSIPKMQRLSGILLGIAVGTMPLIFSSQRFMTEIVFQAALDVLGRIDWDANERELLFRDRVHKACVTGDGGYDVHTNSVVGVMGTNFTQYAFKDFTSILWDTPHKLVGLLVQHLDSSEGCLHLKEKSEWINWWDSD